MLIQNSVLNLRKYKFIIILDSVDDALSSLDCQPNYLHIHILDSKKGQKFSDILKQVNSQSPMQPNIDSAENILLQWGQPFGKEAMSRSVVVKAKDLENFDVGLGSFGIGNESVEKDKNSFISGGEAYKMGQDNFRITKGNAVFEVDKNQGYWIFQTTTFKNAQIYSDVIGQEIDGREKLLDFLKGISNDSKPFVAMFEASFIGDFYSRSNGIFPEDLIEVEDPKKILFSSVESIGGHLLGGSNNQGDIISLQQKLSKTEAEKHDFKIKIHSPIIFKPIELRIVKSCSKGLSDLSLEVLAGNQFSRLPRSKVKVLNAVNLLQKFFRSKQPYK